MRSLRLFLTIFLTSFNLASALEITEISYDPAGSDTSNEWIELYNDTGSDINLITHKLFEGNVNHGISAHRGGNIVVPGEYVILADNASNFVSTHSSYVGKVFDSAFSLANTGELLEMRTSSGAILFSVNYKPDDLASNTGGTLNYVKSTSSSAYWAAYAESPGEESPAIPVTPASGGSGGNTSPSTGPSVSNYSVGYTSRTYTLGDLSMLTPKEIYTVAGAATNFFVKPLDSKKNIVGGNTYWSFGDGASGYGASTTHKYSYAGVYTAYVETEINTAYGIESIKVIVSNPDIIISDVGEGYVTLKNNSKEDLNIGGLVIGSDQGYYKLSRQLSVKSGEELRVDGKSLGFSNLTGVKLLGQDMSLITKYIASSTLTSSSTQVKSTSTVVKKFPVKKVSARPLLPTDPIKSSSTKNQSASTSDNISSKTVQIPTIKKEKNWLYWLYD